MFQSMHALTQGGDTSFYLPDTSAWDVWQYMPVDSGEVVVEIWMHDDHLDGTCLMVMSSLTRPCRYTQR